MVNTHLIDVIFLLLVLLLELRVLTSYEVSVKNYRKNTILNQFKKLSSYIFGSVNSEFTGYAD
jgi:hypothetical protein